MTETQNEHYIENRDLSENNGIISGYASVFDVTDADNDIVQRGAFHSAIEKFRDGKKPKLLWQHDVTRPIGVIEKMHEDAHGLYIEARLLLDLPYVKDIYCLLKNNAINGFSIGYRINKKFNQAGKTVLTDIDLLEISVVTFPACESATVSVKSKEMEEIHNMITELKNNVKNISNNISNNINIRRTKMETMPLSGNVNNYIKKGLEDYIRTGSEELFKKSLHSGEEPGSLFLPTETALLIKDKMVALSPMRSICNKMTISRNSVDVLIDSQLPDADWGDLSTQKTISDTPTPSVKKITIPVYELFARPKVSQQLLDDAQINVEEWLLEKIAQKFALVEDKAFINGSGNHEPIGVLSYETDDAADDTREFGKLQHFKTGANGKFQDAISAVNLLIEMVCSIRPTYVKNAKWIMSRSALAEIRKLKNAEGLMIWHPSLSEATPSTLLGYPVIIDDEMPILKDGTASTSIAFGDFTAGYQIADRQEFSILRDPFTSKPHVEFYATKRVGGGVIDFNAIKVLKFAE